MSEQASKQTSKWLRLTRARVVRRRGSRKRDSILVHTSTLVVGSELPMTYNFFLAPRGITNNKNNNETATYR